PGGGPSGFSFEASLTIDAGSRPSSRATNSTGLPGSYTGCVATAGRAISCNFMLRGNARTSPPRQGMSPADQPQGCTLHPAQVRLGTSPIRAIVLPGPVLPDSASGLKHP